jgi:hypothetical protein
MIWADPQAIGWKDDWSDSGHLKASIVRDGLVKMGFRNGHVITSAACVFNRDVTGDNGDYSSSTISVTLPGGPGAVAATIRFPFYGNAFGVRWDRNFDVTQNDFGVMIDGESFYVPAARSQWDTQLTYNTPDGENRHVVARDLGDGLHWADLVFPANQSGTTLKWLLYGYLVERRASYETPFRGRQIMSQTTLTTTATAINMGSIVGRQPRGVRQIVYSNTSAATATVTLQYSGATFWTKSIAAGDTQAFDAGDVFTADFTQIKHFAGAASAVQATVIGGY